MPGRRSIGTHTLSDTIELKLLIDILLLLLDIGRAIDLCRHDCGLHEVGSKRERERAKTVVLR